MNGGAGDDRISYIAYGNSAQIDLGAGTATALGGYISIEGALGSVYSDTLIGTAGNDTFNVTADGSGVVNGIFSFTAFEVLDGGLGMDVLSHAGYATAVVLDLENNTASGVDAFSSFEAFVGSGSAADEIHGKAAGSIFTINAADGGMVDTALFSAYESLLGGAADDTFAFSGSGSLRGWLNGGLGTDTLTYSLYGSGVITDLANLKSTGVTGKVSAIENVVGSAHNDTLSGDNNDNVLQGLDGNDTLNGKGGSDTYIFADDFGLDTVSDSGTNGTDRIDLSGLSGAVTLRIYKSGLKVLSGANQITFNASIEEILATTHDDRIELESGAAYSGRIDGNDGVDWLDYSAYTASVTVDLATSTVPGIGTIASIEGVLGSIYDDRLYGDDGDNMLQGGLGNDYLAGRDGDDTYRFANGFGGDVVVELDGEGDDTFDFSAVDQSLTFTFYPTQVTVSYGLNLAVHDGIFIEHFIGGSADDLVVVKDGAVVDGTLDGSDGKLTLDLSEHSGDATFILTDLGTNRGFQGCADIIPGGFDDVEEIIVSLTGFDVLIGMDVDALWALQSTSGTYTATNVLVFSGFDSLVGGSGTDTFRTSEGTTFAGGISGGDGADVLDYGSYSSDVTTSVVSYDALLGLSGISSDLADGFASIESILAGSGSNSFTGLDGTATFTLGTLVRYTVEGLFIDLQDFDFLNGGSGADTFVLDGTETYSGGLNGGAGAWIRWITAATIRVLTWTWRMPLPPASTAVWRAGSRASRT